MSIKLIIPPRPTDLGGFSVQRILPFRSCRMVGPWVFFDHMGPATFPAGKAIDVRPHPHINLATVTYLFRGEMLHRDSLGSKQTITTGAVNLMVAGKGIVHSERVSEAIKASGQTMEGLQLWHALPEEFEEIEPEFHHYPALEIPETTVAGSKIRVLIGEAYGLNSPVKVFAETLYIEAKMPQSAKLQIPASAERAIYVLKGKISIADKEIKPLEMAVLDGGDVEVTALEDSEFVVIGGEKFSKRHIYWNFVSSRPERIEQAKQDWREMKFPLVPGDDQEFIPLPEDS